MNDEIRGFVVNGILVTAVLVAMLMIGFSCGRDWVQHKAIEAGAAEWKVDPKTGTTEFVFKPYPESPIPEPAK